MPAFSPLTSFHRLKLYGVHFRLFLRVNLFFLKLILHVAISSQLKNSFLDDKNMGLL